MTRPAQKTKAEPERVSRADMLAAIGRKVAALRARDGELLREVLDLEGSNVAPMQPGAERTVRDEAIRLLNGHAPPGAAHEPGIRLFEALRERQAIKLALDLLDDEHRAAQIARAGEILQANEAEWQEITRERIDACLALRRANARAAAFRARIVREGGAHLTLPHDPTTGIFAAPTNNAGPVYEWLAAAVRAGLLTQEEMDASR